jgi:hypothetical protein
MRVFPHVFTKGVPAKSQLLHFNLQQSLAFFPPAGGKR